MTLLPVRVTVLPVLPCNVPAVMMPLCVTAPLMVLPVTPRVTVPAPVVPPVVMAPRAAPLAFCRVTAVPVALVVVSAPPRLMSCPAVMPPASTRMVPAPASTGLLLSVDTPPPCSLMLPPWLLMLVFAKVKGPDTPPLSAWTVMALPLVVMAALVGVALPKAICLSACRLTVPVLSVLDPATICPM